MISYLPIHNQWMFLRNSYISEQQGMMVAFTAESKRLVEASIFSFSPVADTTGVWIKASHTLSIRITRESC